MRKNIFLTITMTFAVSNLLAGPEKHDHLEAYKKALVEINGPAEELVKDANGNQLAKAIYTYNDKKQIREIKYYNNATLNGRNVFEYDEIGLKQEELFDKNNKLIEKLVYTRNKQNQVTEFEVFDAKNVSIVKWKFQYDGKRVVSGSRYINNEVTEKFINKYNASGMVQQIFVDNSESAGNITVNMENSKVTRRVKKEAIGVHSIDYFYDNQGRIEKMIFSKINDTKTEVEKTHLFNYTLPYMVAPLKVTEN